ncbi:putative RNA-directed DNA polymerase from transposon BS [Caerostris extrusa]|uniref:RNA-directed DNA polymerase from transposon BS n=1 Tax=Caerostris extrusa TaxID=172846 RepID=A0AAV4XIJ7_CAEEX|nr:putative RNA-directed DNA polymerase from transposon BS [Caerostris extrusa]
MVLWRKQVALFKKAVLEAKRKCFDDFISNINYKEDTPFTLEELRLAIEFQRVKKSPGADNIHVEFLKHMSDTVKNTLLCTFNRIWETGLVPAQWKRAVVIPILKKNKDPKQLSSYRPISLTSILGKTTEKLILNRLNWYLEDRNLIVNEQAGFRKNRSTTDQVTYLIQIVKDALDNRNILTAVYVDFKSAYDTLWREKLHQKLLNAGVCGNMFKWIRSFTDQRICKIKFGNGLSKCLQTGLTQGAVESYSLFNLYINDLVSALETVKDADCLLFADDLVIWTQAPKRNAKSLIKNKINKAIDILSDWCIKNNLTVNLEKTATQTFSLAHQTLLPDLKYRDAALIYSSKFNYLGVTFDNKLY